MVVLGAGGFLGKALLADPPPMPVRAVARSIPGEATSSRRGISWHAADLTARGSLDNIVQRGDVVVNLAFAADETELVNLALAANIVGACVRAGAARLVHCSTAVVVGGTREKRVTECTVCAPQTQYQRTKLRVERLMLDAAADRLDVGVLRPTAVVGAGGQNLVSLARALEGGNPIANYLRACLFGRRPMNLVPVQTVAAALVHLAVRPALLAGSIYIVTSDDPTNNFQCVEARLRRGLRLPPRSIPPFPLPRPVLSWLLRVLHRSESDAERTYDGTKLRRAGFTSTHALADAIMQFAAALHNDAR